MTSAETIAHQLGRAFRILADANALTPLDHNQHHNSSTPVSRPTNSHAWIATGIAPVLHAPPIRPTQAIIQDDLPCQREDGHAHSLDQKPKGFLVTRCYTRHKLLIPYTRNGAALAPALSSI